MSLLVFLTQTTPLALTSAGRGCCWYLHYWTAAVYHEQSVPFSVHVPVSLQMGLFHLPTPNAHQICQLIPERHIWNVKREKSGLCACFGCISVDYVPRIIFLMAGGYSPKFCGRGKNFFYLLNCRSARSTQRQSQQHIILFFNFFKKITLAHRRRT